MVVGEGGVSPEYFLKKMHWWEVQRYINGIRRRERTAWETMRHQTYLILSALGAKKEDGGQLRVEDIVTLPWRDRKSRAEQERDEAELRELLERCKQENEANEREG